MINSRGCALSSMDMPESALRDMEGLEQQCSGFSVSNKEATKIDVDHEPQASDREGSGGREEMWMKGRYSNDHLLVSGNYEFDKKNPREPLKEGIVQIQEGYFGRIDNLVIDQERRMMKAYVTGTDVLEAILDDYLVGAERLITFFTEGHRNMSENIEKDLTREKKALIEDKELNTTLNTYKLEAQKAKEVAHRDAKKEWEKKIEGIREELVRDIKEALALLRSNFVKDAREQYEMLELRKDYYKGLASTMGAVFEDSDPYNDIPETPEVPSGTKVVDDGTGGLHPREMLDVFTREGLPKVDDVVSPPTKFVLLAMADALISVVVEQLATFLLEKLKKEVKLLLGAPEDVQELHDVEYRDLTSNLNRHSNLADDEKESEAEQMTGGDKVSTYDTFDNICDVLDDAEKRHVKNILLNLEKNEIKKVPESACLEKLKAVSCKMENVLDEWHIKIMKSEIAADGNSAPDSIDGTRTGKKKAYEEGVQKMMASLQTYYFGDQCLSLPTPIPVPQLFMGGRRKK
ncbi:hypothetical protein GIB67_001252 [Kingdonia uniflora]|uniref:Uncharacterized protein n=1 Tax=Kingdonia uniflora TaxID=39325 RepID=A0A7J7L7X4_9MAGN|nr:hypothetical protein GIB67_001252 [Kingdonia uniflora]